MLIAHISDTHLGFTQYGIEERENDFYNAFSEAMEIIVKEHVDLVIHSGDIFDTPRPSGTAIVRLLDELKRLEENNIKFVFILGEHDISRLRSVPVPILYKKVKLATHLNNIVKINDVSIVGYNKYRLHEIHLLKKYLSDLNIDGKKILVLHQGLKEFHEYAGELTHLDLPNNFNYYAFGHLHNKCHKWFDGFKGPVCYPGSTEITTFTPKEDLEKGFCLVDLSREADINWIKLKTREHRVEDLEDNEKLEDYINSLIDKLKTSRPILKLRFNDIDVIKARSIVRKLESYALHIITEYNKYYDIQKMNKPISIDDEMLRRSADILNSKDKARFAIIELLPSLLKSRDEALDLLWNAYKNNRFG